MRKRKTGKLLLDAKWRQPLDKLSRRLTGKGQRRLLAIANKMLGEPLIEKRLPEHTVIDDRVPAEQIGTYSRLRPTWVGRA
jgi:hypothetical protein